MAVVATGFFDGVHLGHRRVIDALVRSARMRAERAVAVTFSQHPRAVLQQDATSLRLLNSTSEKMQLLKGLGVDHVEILPFTKEFASMTAEEYIRDVLVGRLGATAVVIGYDNRFGSDCLSLQQIADLLEKYGMETIRAGVEDSTVSSTSIRRALSLGNVEEASEMLGYSYSLCGVVVPGKRLGRTIGFPTANLQLMDPLKQIPSGGVYLTMSTVMGRTFPSMTNVGDVIETNIFDFDEDIYSLELCVSFLRRIRDMRVFSSLEELSSQLAADRSTCLSLL